MHPSPSSHPSKHRPKTSRHASSVVGFLVSLFLLGAAGWLVANRQFVIDQVTALEFRPEPALQAIIDRSSLSEKGIFYLYASQAKVVDRTGFNRSCGSLQNEKTVILGCYRTPENKIYVFDVADPRLDGIKEATTVHEMLHAAYDRLSESEKNRVNGLLQDQAKKVTDPRLLQIIQFYHESEPGDVTNELHSIFGSEVRGLTPELEQYYAQYFQDRTVTLGFKEKYEKIFADLSAHQQQLVTELQQLQATIERRQQAYQSSLNVLERDIRSFNTWARSGNATSDEFNGRRTRLQARIDGLNAEQYTLNTLIDTYNSKRAELEALNLQAEQLNGSIDSKLTPLPSL